MIPPMTITSGQTAAETGGVDRCDWVWVDSVEKRRRAQEDLSRGGVIGLDTEYDSFRYFRERLCLLQVRNDRTTYLFDPLGNVDFTFLAHLFHTPSILKIVHAGDNDIRILKRDYPFRFQGVFDTYRAASLLGCRQLALATLIQQYLGVAFDKKKRLQRSRWDQRPLTDEQIHYAVQDTALLLPLYEILQAELDERGLRQEAERAFEEVCRVEWTQKTLDRRGHARISGYADMSPEQQKRLKKLYRWRFEKAFQTDRAAFMILSDADMVNLVKEADEGPLGGKARNLPLRGQANRYLADIVNILNE